MNREEEFHKEKIRKLKAMAAQYEKKAVYHGAELNVFKQDTDVTVQALATPTDDNRHSLVKGISNMSGFSNDEREETPKFRDPI
jgi:hypothetical protein